MLDRPNINNIKYYYCNRCTYWPDSQIKYDNSFKPEVVCPKKNKITFINEQKRQIIKNFITADIECCVTNVLTATSKYVIADHIPLSVGLECIKRLASVLLEIETEHNFKRNKQMIFNEEDKLYHETNNTCHICSKNLLIK